jgi:hypothetical protein
MNKTELIDAVTLFKIIEEIICNNLHILIIKV